MVTKLDTDGVLSANQACLFRDIAEIRNKYVHVSAKKLLNDWSVVLSENDGLLEFANDIMLNDFGKESDGNVRETLRHHIEHDSLLINGAFTELLKTLKV